MNNKLPTKQHNNLFRRIKEIFKKILFKGKIENNYKEIVEQPEIEKENSGKRQFEDNIKVETNNDYINEIEREEFLDKIESNPKLLYDLPIGRLTKLESYYASSIKKYEEKLARMKKVS